MLSLGYPSGFALKDNQNFTMRYSFAHSFTDNLKHKESILPLFCALLKALK